MHDVRTRDRFPADILADMAFAELHAASGGSPDQIDLFHALACHG